MKRTSVYVVSGLVLALAACQRNPSKLDDMKSGPATTAATPTGPASTAPATPAQDIDSKDILARTETADEVTVKHVLIGWKELAPVYRGQIDPRAKDRSNADAAKLAQEIYAELKADPSKIDDLMKKDSEDPGSKSGEPYTVNKDTQFVPEFKKLALRLHENEVGIVKTQFGYHVIERVPPPPPDPLESADILARPAEKGPVQVQHILIGFKDATGKDRTKEDAGKLVTEVMGKVKSGADFKQLMKQYSDDPGSKDSGRAYDVAANAPGLPEQMKKLSLRLKENEIGVVKAPYGYQIIKRLPPPPPDPLDSADILKRAPVTQTAKVKHILLGWTDAHTEDPRGVKRSRADLEKLVKETVAKLKKGDKIEPLMAELSEDPGSAKSGQSYDVTPDAGLVEPFKNLSLRLNKGEVGVVKSQFGIHIIQREE